MRKIKSVVIVVLLLSLLFCGVGIALYPNIMRYLSLQENEITVMQTKQTALKYSSDEHNSQIKLAKEYNSALQSLSDVESVKILNTYNDILNLGSGIMGTISIPSISIELPIYHGISEDTLRKGAGHLSTSSFPIGDNGTHSVITGHNGLPESELFTNLDKLQIGDKFTIQIMNTVTEYTVDEIRVVEPYDVNNILPSGDKCYVSLVTCTPYRINSHRLVVRGERSDGLSQTETQTEVTETLTAIPNVRSADNLIICFFCASFAVVIAIILIIRRKNRYEK